MNPIKDEITRRRFYHERLYIVIIVIIVSYSEKRETHTLHCHFSISSFTQDLNIATKTCLKKVSPGVIASPFVGARVLY